MAEIGVIIPVYNVELYLRTCIDSILYQTFHDFEVILVDDGSTDKSGEICDEYAEKYGNVKVLHIEHQGVANARNRGMDENTAEYITFVDSDDWIEKQYLETLYQVITAYHADLVISCGKNVLEGEEIVQSSYGNRDITSEAEIISRSEAYRRMLTCENNVSITAWAKMYHKRLTKLFRYPIGEIFEDIKVISNIIEGCEKIVCTSYSGYFYRRRSGSIMHGKMSPEYMIGLHNARCLWDFIRNNYPDIEGAAKVHYLRLSFNIFNIMMLSQDYQKECQKLRKEIISEEVFFLSCSYVNLVEKTGAVCLLCGTFWYRLAWRFYLRWTGKESGKTRH